MRAEPLRAAFFAGCLLAAALGQGWLVTPVEAQTRRNPPRRPRAGSTTTPHAGSWEVSGGLLWQGGFDLGTADAELIRNPATGTGPYDLFSSGTSLGPGVGFQGRITAYLSRSVALEGGLRLTRPVLTVDLTSDVESARDQSAEETLTQYVIDGSAVWHLGAFRRGRVVPFVAGGAGYIRDLHEGSELMETGVEYHAAAGVKWWLSSGRRRFGLRAEGGASIRDGGFDFREGRRTLPYAAASLAYLF